MKSKKKVFVTVLCAAALVVASVLGTMAYLTSKDTVTNTFSVGDVNITLDEAKVDTAGTPVSPAERVKDNSYKLIPGHEYTKDPIIHVTKDSEASWVFVKVDNALAGAEAATTTTTDGYKNINDQIKANGWTVLETGVYYKEVSAADAKVGIDLAVFNKFKANDALDGEALAEFANKKITVTGYAIQKDGFDDVAKAWAEVKDVQ